jgi:hypothetical protein
MAKIGARIFIIIFHHENDCCFCGKPIVTNRVVGQWVDTPNERNIYPAHNRCWKKHKALEDNPLVREIDEGGNRD